MRWAPAALAFRDEETLMTARRGGWSIHVSYRTWIADSGGHVDAATHGIASQPVADGMLQTYSTDGLDKIRHT